MYRLVHGNCLKTLPTLPPATCLFADPPDGIGLKYNEFDDRTSESDYVAWLENVVNLCANSANICWLSFNARWTFAMGSIFKDFLAKHRDWESKPCVQTFTFGQHNQNDLGNNHRPLWRLKHKDAPLYPDQIRIPSWRQLNGDKRADPRGRVPGDVYVTPDDVFDFPRVTGNSRQRRNYHPTQTHEGLVERCILLSTKVGESVIDPFGGTGTTLRVCQRIGRLCTLIELDRFYCDKMAEEHGLIEEEGSAIWNSPNETVTIK